MLSRRHVLIGSACTILAPPARAETAGDGFIVLRATATGYGGTVPGPVIRVRRGDEVKVRLINERDQATSIVWHGVRLPSAMDPLGRQPAAPGASLDYRFTVPDAGTFWYRSTRQSEQERGLYGALIVEEPVPPPVDRDQLLMFAAQPDGIRRFTLNGAKNLDIPARTNERLRLRFVNASATQVMDARIEGHRVTVMALDGEAAEPFPSRDSRIALGPGNRADVFVDATLAPGSIAPLRFMSPGGEVQLARIVYDGTPARAAPLGEPAPLPPNPLPDRMNFSRALRVTVPLDHSTRAPDRAAAPLFTAERGRTVMMALENRDGEQQVVHLHGHHFRLLDRLDDGWKPYWLDTLVVDGKQTARIAFVADNPGRWPIEHRALGSAAVGGERWFQVK